MVGPLPEMSTWLWEPLDVPVCGDSLDESAGFCCRQHRGQCCEPRHVSCKLLRNARSCDQAMVMVYTSEAGATRVDERALDL